MLGCAVPCQVTAARLLMMMVVMRRRTLTGSGESAAEGLAMEVTRTRRVVTALSHGEDEEGECMAGQMSNASLLLMSEELCEREEGRVPPHEQEEYNQGEEVVDASWRLTDRGCAFATCLLQRLHYY